MTWERAEIVVGGAGLALMTFFEKAIPGNVDPVTDEDRRRACKLFVMLQGALLSFTMNWARSHGYQVDRRPFDAYFDVERRYEKMLKKTRVRERP